MPRTRTFISAHCFSCQKETNLPDPDLPLNEKIRIAPLEPQIKRLKGEPGTVEYSKQRSASGSFDIEIPIFSPVGGGVGYGGDANGAIKVGYDRLETERFVPSLQYLSEAVKDDFVQEYCRQHRRPSVYMVTGLKIAYNAVIEMASTGGRQGHGSLNVDLTATGAPLKIGPSLEAAKGDTRGTKSTIKESFILAYQLKRLEMKSDGTMKSTEGYNKHALMDDRKTVSPEAAVDDFERSWDIQDVCVVDAA